MNLAHIELSQLIISPANMRAKRKDRDIADLIPSVAARGVLVPLLVRPNGAPDGFEIIAGRRRYFAAKAVAASRGETMTLPCAIVEPGDDAAAVEASLIENIARLDADEVTQWETFSRLIKEGRSAEDIAATFGLPDTAVRRVLALGNLLPRIRALYRNELIDASVVRQLTMATPAQQREWLALFDSPEAYAPTGRVLKEWLFGGAAVPVSTALFELSTYTAPIVNDLFGEHSYFSDSALFWKLQIEAIEAKRQAYLADAWSEVVVIDGGHWFDRWAHEERSKAKGGRVYIAVSEQGGVEIHEGYLPRKEAKRIEDNERSQPSPARPELTAPLRRYVDLHRHVAVRAALLEHPWIALRLMLAHAIAGSTLWTVRLERQQADKEDTAKSVASAKAQAVFEAARKQTFVKLGFDPDTHALYDIGKNTSLTFIFETLLLLGDEELLTLIPIVMGETLEASGEMIEPVGALLTIDMGSLWDADEAFFALLRDRTVLTAMLVEVAGMDAAKANADAPTKVMKIIVRDCLAGRNGRPKVENWAPRWLRFPKSSYLDDGSLESPQPSVANGETEQSEVIPPSS